MCSASADSHMYRPCATAAGGHVGESSSAPAAQVETAAASLAALQLKQRQLWSGAQADECADSSYPTADQPPQPSDSMDNAPDSTDNNPASAPLCAFNFQPTQAHRPSAATSSMLTNCAGHVSESVSAPVPTADCSVDQPAAAHIPDCVSANSDSDPLHTAAQKPDCAIAKSAELPLQAATVASSQAKDNDSGSVSPGGGVQPAVLDKPSQGVSCARRAEGVLGGSETVGSSSGSSGRAVGRELFITGSYFNHSCAPNCIIHRTGAFGFVFTQAHVEVRLSNSVGSIGSAQILLRTARRVDNASHTCP